ncbi:MAG: aprataxin-like protein [Pycnora praestabilis]|nr:MAG: aprataxin-like protein [Pycnora praestabilis]
MPNNGERGEEAVDGEEIAGTAVPGQARNACTTALTHLTTPKHATNSAEVTDLMTKKAKRPTTPTKAKKPAPNVFAGRDGLGAYIQDPASFPPQRVIYYTEKWVVINDLYPKSSIHILLLPRDSSKNLLHPFDAFEDPTLRSEVQAEVKKLRVLVAKELQRKYGKYSAQDRDREAALEAEKSPDVLPKGRHWEKDVISGIHAGPSMNHLHVHVMSIDRMSECLRHRKHYNSFNTPFLIDVGDFPLAKNDVRRRSENHYLESDLRCWRCGKNFGNKFARLKEHLADEFEVWKRE